MTGNSSQSTAPRLDDWVTKIGERHPATLVPGYWNGIATNCIQWAKSVTAARFWGAVEANIIHWSNEFHSKTGADLLAFRDFRAFSPKEEGKIKEKVVRICRRKAQELESVIDAQPPIPTIDDMVRTRVVCKYIDGVEFFTNKLEELARSEGCFKDRRRVGRTEGYFAQHMYFTEGVYYSDGGTSLPAKITCEVQVATETATHIWNEGHFLYEEDRSSSGKAADWQWNPTDLRFISNQLGHMLHLADGLVMQLRDGNKGKL